MGRKLSDRHIIFAQDLLKSQFENINGLECTLTQSKTSVPVLSEDAIKNKLQVFHDRHDHWIAASNVLTREAGQVAACVRFSLLYLQLLEHFSVVRVISHQLLADEFSEAERVN